MSITTLGKPVPCKSTSDWLCGVWNMRQSAQTARHDGFQLRQEARTLRNEARIRTDYDRYHNDLRLTDRITEVGKWREILKRAQGSLKAEQKELDLEKERCEDLLEKISCNVGLVNECLAFLERRLENDMTCDEAVRELRNELACFEAQLKVILDRCNAAFDEHNRLEELTCNLERAVKDQEVAMELDSENLTQTRNSSNISYKPDPYEQMPNTMTQEAWLDHMRCLKMRADNEVAGSMKLREAMTVSRVRAENDMRTQKNLTEFALRKTAYDTQRAKNELEWQKHKLKEDMAKLLQEIRNLECSLRDKLDNAQMLAETRLETRKYRPNCEFVTDEPMNGLIDEIEQVKRTRRELQDKLNNAKATYNAMEDLLVCIDRDLEGKSLALTSLLQAIDTHQRTGPICSIPANPSTGRNLALTHYDKEIAPCQGPSQVLPSFNRESEPWEGKCGIRQQLTC